MRTSGRTRAAASGGRLGCAGSVALACWCIDRLVFHFSGPVVVSGVACKVLVVVPVAEAAYAVGSGEVGNTLKATQPSQRDVAAIPAGKLDFRVPDGIAPHKDLRLDAISLSETQLAIGTVLAPVHDLCNVHDALENAGAPRQPYVEHVRCVFDVRAPNRPSSRWPLEILRVMSLASRAILL